MVGHRLRLRKAYATVCATEKKGGGRATKRERTKRTKKIMGEGEKEQRQSWGRLPPGAEGDGRPWFHGSRWQPREAVLLNMPVHLLGELSQTLSSAVFTLFTYFQTSSKAVMFLVLLAYRARSRWLHLMRNINYLTTYLLTYLLTGPTNISSFLRMHCRWMNMIFHSWVESSVSYKIPLKSMTT